jgi:hypothetical protein
MSHVGLPQNPFAPPQATTNRRFQLPSASTQTVHFLGKNSLDQYTGTAADTPIESSAVDAVTDSRPERSAGFLAVGHGRAMN